MPAELTGATKGNPMSRPHLTTAAASLILLPLALTGCSTAASGDHSSASSSTGAREVTANLTSDGDGAACKLSTTSVPAGAVTFRIHNISSPEISEVELQQDQRILAEKENLAPGLKPVEFTVTLDGGTYTVYCPGAKKALQTFTVTGKAKHTTGSTQQLLKTGAKQYGDYVDQQIDSLATSTAALDAAVQSGDVQAARTAYAEARPYYERVESDVDGFVLPGYDATDNHGNLDYLIDMRASNLDEAVGWHGFHAVERDLFGAGITDTTKALSTELLANVNKLKELSGSLTYSPEDLANGAAGLLEEVQSEKITGDEEQFSHLDLIDFAANVEGAQEAFAFLKPGLKKINADSTTEISAQFTKVTALLNTYKDPSALGGYRTYDQALRASDSAKLSKAVQALQDPLAGLAAKVATA